MSDASLEARLAAGAERLERLRRGLSENRRAAIERRLRGGRDTAPAAADAIPRRGGRCRADAGGEPLSFAQERLWFLAQLEPDRPAYNLAAAVRLEGELDVPALAGALTEIVRRHETLRSRFVSREGQPAQATAPPPPCAAFLLPVVDLGRLPGEAAGGRRRAEAEGRRLAAAAARQPFDLATGPLLRLLLLREAPRAATLVAAMHHIVADAWSCGVLVSELAALYGALAAGRAPALPVLPIQYADFARWQRRRLTGPTLEGLLAYWRARLAGLPPELALPADRPRPAAPGGRGGRHSWSASPELAARVRGLAQGSGATLFMALLAAFQGLLGRLTGQLDVAVGAPVAGRGRVETEGLIGFFVNTLVLRLDLAGDPDFGVLLARAREATLGALAHQELPFERLVADLRPDRAGAHNPLFQVAFVLQNAPVQALRLPGLTIAASPVPTGGAMFDLTFELGEDGGGGLAGHLDYDRDLFDAATAARLARHFSAVLDGGARVPGMRFADLPLLGPVERHQLLHEWSGGAAAFPRDATLHGSFAEWARRTPHAIALQWTAAGRGADADEARTMTYAELAARAGRLAGRLRRLGVGPEVPVALCLERGPHLIVALLAVLEAGGAYLPLDPAGPRERQALILDDLLPAAAEPGGRPETAAAKAATPATPRPALLLTERRFAGAFGWLEEAGGGGRLLCLDEEGGGEPAAATAPTAPTATAPGATADNLAYVIHTSGSTGRPKGVAVTHRAAVRLVRGSGCARFAPDEVFLALAPVSFDASTFEIWGPLANGGRLALMPPETPALAELAAAIARHGVTTLWLTAGLFHQMVDEQLDGLRPVRQLLAGGDALSPAHARRLLAALPATRLVNGYGPTENTTFTCCGPLPAGAGGAALPLGGGVPIGRPIGNTDAFVLCGGSAAAPPAALAPIGVAGELVTGGDGLARGYYRRPDSTAESFRPHPFAAVPGARVYHTGDRVRFLADGRLDFLGRCDRQVKVRGFRVEPGEVEAALTGHPAVAAAVVTAVAEPGAAGGKRLAAYLVAHGGPGAAPLPPPQALRAWLRGRLPEVLVPQAFVALAALPLTPNGKIDRAALPDPDFGAGAAGGGGGQPVRAPRTPEEDLLAAIWTEVLGREGIGIDDDFFALGGHSLLATRVASRLRVAFGVELPLRRLFAAPTIAALARAVAAARRERGGQDTAPPRPRPRGAEPPLSFAQERLWFLDQLQPGNPAYNLALAVSLHGDLAPAALGAAIATVTRRHEVLRTRFPARHGRPWQEIALPPPRPAGTAPAMVTLPQVDLRRLPLPGRQPELDRQLADLASRPFDLAHGPLVRWALLRLANDGEDHPAALAALGGRQGAGATATGASPDRPPGAASVFACVQHHIITDGWSLGLLWRDLAALYAAFSGAGPDSGPGSGEAPARTPGRADDAAPQPLPYADYAVWQREMLASGAFAPQLAYWRERLAGELPVLALPVDRQRRAGPAGGGVVAAALPPELSARVAACGRRAGATPFMTLLAAWTVLLHRLGGQDDVLVGVPIAGRNRVEIEGTLGFFVNTLVLRTDLAGNPPFRALLAQVREGALGAYAHQDLPFERLVAELQPERNLARAPLVQVFFNHLNFENFSAAALPGLTTLVMPIAAPPAKFELSVYAAERQGSFLLRLHYDSAIFDQARIAEMARQLERLLAAFCGEENGPLDDAHPAHSAHPAHPEEAAEPGIDDVSLLTPSAAAVLPDPRRALAAAASGGAGGRSVGELVSRQAHRAGWRLAVADEAERFTYGALETAANRLARFLETAGLAPGEVVAIAAERRAALAWAVVGAVKARAAFLLLDPAHPAARRAAMLRLAGARAYVCLPGADTAAAEPEIAAAVAGLRLRCTVSPRQAAELTARGAADPGAPAPPGPDDLAYVVFTSGSTGEPKAVAGTHAPLCHFIAWYAAACGLAESDRFALLSGLGHDPLLRDLLTPLALGASLWAPAPGDLEQPERLVNWLAAREVTVLHLTPAFGQLLAQGAAGGTAEPGGPCRPLGGPPLPALRLACFGGDQLAAEDVTRLRALAPAARLLNLYGTTETPQAMGWIEVPPAAELAARGALPVPVGRGIDGVELLVRTDRGGWAGVGELGEIVVRTPFLARGYLGDEALTRERFLPDPAGGRAGLYRTGDLGRYRPNGSLEVAGRADRQIKLRGFRIEPAEIEAALASHPAIAAAAVVAVAAAHETWLAAFVVARPGMDAPPAGELRQHLALRLPPSLLPACIAPLDRLPLTPNGKVDRRALVRRLAGAGAAGPASAAAAGRHRVTARDPIEEVVAGIWEEVLGSARTGGAVGPDDDFFALGGHSLLATQVLSRLGLAFAVEVPLRRLFATPTPAGLAAAVATAKAAGTAAHGEPAAGVLPAAPPPLLVAAPGGGEPPPLSFAQESLWFFEQHLPGTAAYNLPLALRLRGKAPQVAALRSALAEVARRHEALRTGFAERAALSLPGDGPVQVITPPDVLAAGGGAAGLLPLVDLSGLPAQHREPLARELAAATAAAPFTLERAPLWRARLLRLAAAEHVLLFAAHHIICDGWSIGVLAAELDALLGALAGGRPSPLPPLALQPADFARWQRRWLAGPARDALLAWWRPRFAGAPPLLELPTDRPRPVRPRHRGARIGWQLGPALSAALAGRAHRQGATPFMLLLAAFAALLGRASGQDDLVIGLSIAQRNRAELEPLIGFLVNLLALRAELRRDPPFARLLAQVRDSTLDALAHQDLPFELLVAELRPERGVAYSPLFQVLCTLQSAPLPARLAGLELEPFAFGRQAAHFDLTLSFARGEDGTIAGYLEYDVDLFDAATARRTVAHFQTLLAALAADLEHRLSELPLLGPAESHQLREWNDTAAAYPAGSCLHELIAAQARRTPEATAVAVASANDGGNGANDGGNDGDDGEQLSFAELTAAAESLAARLRAAGVGPGVLVALHLERSPALAVAVLAVLATGGAYLPLDLGEPADRLAWVLEDARPRAAVTRRAGGLAARLLAATEGGLKIVCLDEPPLESPRRPAAAPPYGASPHAGRPGLAATPDDLAYVLYTSGSTGRPKGVMVPHRALVNYLSWAVAAYEVAAGCGAPVHTPLAFDLTVTSLLAPWLAGRCALLVPESDGVDGLGRMLAAPPSARGAFSLVKLTPAHLPLLAEQAGTAAPGRTRALVVGGEALAGESLETWRRAAPATLVINEYGPTEATVGCCVHRAPAGALGDGPVPIGRPIANARLYVVDRHLRPVPLGASGELLIGGNGLARGYLRRSALTAERFVPDPFGDAPGGRLYRTGDRVRQRANGSCEYLGRYDDQVKVRGFRIEIGEVEAALLEHPRLAAAAVAAQPAPAGGKRLVAYVVPRPGAAAPAAAELRQHLAARLPEFMLPARFIPLGGLPLTGNGKVDRQALPQLAAETAVHDAAAVPAPGAATLGPDAPGASAAQGVVALGSAATPEPNAPPAVPAAAAYAPPSTPVEAALAGLWAELLRLPRVGIDDNFFELGGDSILSLQLASRARAIGIAFRSRDVFRHQTIARLAAAAAAAGAAAPAVPPAASLPDPASPAVPLLPIQRWFFDQGLAEPWHNNQAVLLSLRRPLAPPVLAAACARLVECHEALRLRFERDPGATAGWRQRIAPPPPPAALPCIDLSHLSHLSRLGGEAAAAAGVLAAAATALQGGLDLAAGPILRAARFTLPRSIGDGDATPGTRLLLVVHHLAVDGVSWRILLEDLERACTQLERGEPVRLPSPPVPFRRWAASLAAAGGAPALRAELDGWLAVLRAPAAPLPVERLPPPPAGGAAATAGLRCSTRRTVVQLDEADTARLLRWAPAHYRARIDELLLAALAGACRRWTGSPALLVDLEGHGREPELVALLAGEGEPADLSRTVGWLTTIAPVLLDLAAVPPDAGPAGLVREVARQLRAIPNRGAAYGLMRYAGPNAARLAALPAPWLLFNYFGQLDAALPPSSRFAPAPEPAGDNVSPRNRRSHPLQVDAAVSGGRLRMTFSYSADLNRRETIERLAAWCRDELQGLLALPAAGEDADVEDAYPLTPMQQGILFHSRVAASAGDRELYVAQFHCALLGPLDVAALRDAWQRVLDRHAVLRSSFHWASGDGPRQRVHRGIRAPLAVIDWRRVAAARQSAWLAELLAAGRRRGFALGCAPLWRLQLVRLAAGEHRLVFSFHHLLLDGWSMPLLFGELMRLYAGCLHGSPPALPPPRRFRDYLDWLARQDPAHAEDFWRRELAGFHGPTPGPVAPALPEDRGETGRQRSARYTRERHLLASAESGALLSLARRHRLTLGTLVHGAWALLLASHAGVDDVVFGATFSGRPADLAGAEEMLGLFINSLPVRVAIDPGAPLWGWLARLQERLAALRELEHCALAEVQRWSGWPPGAALFSSLVIFENYPVPAGPAMPGAARDPADPARPAPPAPPEDTAGLRIAGVEAVQNTSYPLALVAALRGDRLLLRLAYDAGRHATPAVARTLAQVAALLRDMAREPGGERALGTLSPLGPAERHQLLREWSDTERAPAVGPLLCELFERSAAAAADAAALVFGDLTLSYAEVDARATRLAAALRGLGVDAGGRETLVAIALRRSPWLPICLLAVWKAGGAWLPLDPAYPRQRLAFMLRDSGACLLLAEPDLRRELPRMPGRRALGVEELLDDGGRRQRQGRQQRQEAAVARRDRATAAPAGGLAYVIYTSGSTGNPKGVMIEHRGLANLVREQIAAFDLGPASRVLQLAPSSFDASVSEVWTAWAAGATLILAPDPLPVGDALVRLLVRQQVSVATIPPSLLGTLPPADLPSLHTLVAAGEAVAGALLRRWTQDQRRVLNAYGPTEASVCATIERYLPAAGAEPLLGRPIANTRAWLLDARQRPVPLGAVGEICLSGVGLARGYLGRPDLTAERFLPDPIAASPGARLYRTGDLARFTADGRLAFLGRRDDQVKVRGVRVEIGEVEAVLSRHPEIQAAAVVARRDTTLAGAWQLAAFVVANPAATAGDPALAERLRSFLRGQLPEPMVPGRFAVLAALPRTPAGKLDRRALAAAAAADDFGGSGATADVGRLQAGTQRPAAPATPRPAAPRSGLERFLAALWSEILHVDRPSIDDNFFQLGGHSLSGATLIARLQETLGEIVHVVVMYDAPTVRSLAIYLSEHYPAAVARLFGSDSPPPGRGIPAAGAPSGDGPVTASALAELRRIVARGRLGASRAPAPSAGAAAPNPPALFILSPPRSGSTLLRVMLAGHPGLFAPPELELLAFETLAERRTAFSGRHAFWLEGAVRALMEIRRCDAAAAAARVAELEDHGGTTKELYREMQDAVAPRLLVDKTPSYALDPEVLARAETVFADARYIHLLRHPQAMIHSFTEARLDQVFFRFPHRFTRRQLAELIWQVSEENILGFLAGVPPERQLRLRFEDLVADPAAVLGRLCRWLAIELHPDMARPYERPAARMTDGIHPWSRMLGDVKFHSHKRVDPGTAERWRKAMRGHTPGRATAELAARLGYECLPPPPPEALPARSLPAALVPLQPHGRLAPLLCIHPAGGSALCYRDLAHALDRDRPVFGLEARGIAAGETPLSRMEEIAERSLAAICAAFPDGPCHLLGWSFGGLVAYEIACRLAAAGRAVPLLAILDAGPGLPHEAAAGRPADAGAAATLPRFDAADLLAAAFQSVLPVTAAEVRALPEDERLPHLLARAGAAGKLPPGIDLAHAQRLLVTFQAHQAAARGYRPGPYPGRLTLIRATAGTGPLRHDPTLGWGSLAAAVEIHEVPARHEDIVAPPHVAGLASCLRRCLAATTSDCPPLR